MTTAAVKYSVSVGRVNALYYHIIMECSNTGNKTAHGIFPHICHGRHLQLCQLAWEGLTKRAGAGGREGGAMLFTPTLAEGSPDCIHYCCCAGSQRCGTGSPQCCLPLCDPGLRASHPLRTQTPSGLRGDRTLHTSGQHASLPSLRPADKVRSPCVCLLSSSPSFYFSPFSPPLSFRVQVNELKLNLLTE